MTRRLAFTILLTVWATIVAGGVSAWLAARAVLLADLDASIVQRAMLVPEAVGRAGAGPPALAGDRYVVIGAQSRTLDRQAPARPLPTMPEVAGQDFVDLPEGRHRRLTLRWPASDGGLPLMLVYSASTSRFDAVLWRLAIALAGFGAAGGALAAGGAAGLARVALRPLRNTAEMIGAIDEGRLDRRIDCQVLPPELRPMSERLNEMLARLQQAFEQRRRFLADASHELRTPVAAMITTMEVALLRPRAADELVQTLQTCLAEARHLRALVQALLRQVRAEGRSDDEPPQPVDAAELLGECSALAQSLASQHQVRLLRSVDSHLQVHVEPRRLRSVVLNLMSNAIEYNHAGGTVVLSARRDNGSVEIAVKDDGPGIAPEHLPNLFQPFYRAGPTGDADGHLGLGLCLVQSNVKAMGGQCLVESTVGSGTTFRVRLPHAPTDGQTGAAP